MRMNRLTICCALMLGACAGGPSHATIEVDGKAESVINPQSRNQTSDFQIEGDRADVDPQHSVVFFVDVPTTPGPFDCTSPHAAVTYYEPGGSTPGKPSFVVPTWAADFTSPGTSCSGEWQKEGSHMVGSFRATMTQLLVNSTRTREASGTFDVPTPN
jgi:hypothetical protein